MRPGHGSKIGAAAGPARNDAIRKAQALLLRGAKQEAARIFRQLLRHFPADTEIRNRLLSIGKAAHPDPKLNSKEHKTLQGIRKAAAEGRHDAVVSEGQRLLSAQPELVPLANLMGLSLVSLGRVKDAMHVFNHAIKADPVSPDGFVNLAALLRETDQTKAAFRALNVALEITQEDANIWAAAGLIADDLGQSEDALKYFDRSLALDPSHVGAHDGKCRLFENSNRLDALDEAVENALLHCPDAPEVQYRDGLRHFRRKAYAASVDVLSAIDPITDLSPNFQRNLFRTLGQAHDKLDEIHPAIAAFARMNQITCDLLKITDPTKNTWLDGLRTKAEGAKNLDPLIWRSPVASRTPVFLVGFPRSGTTLLDTILRSHPEISVLEELPLVSELCRDVRPDDEAKDLSALTTDQIEDRRAAYFRAAPDLPKTGLVVDKLPLNLTEVPAILRHFPGAKFILALRHPCDAVLSCWMQNFRPNPSMNAMLSIESAALAYDLSFRLWDLYQAQLSADFVTVRYEDVVADLQTAVVPVLTHLGVDWDPALLQYQKTALDRGRINTPSYHQVSQAIYKDSTDRWRKYEAVLEGVHETLDPWARRWGYSMS